MGPLRRGLILALVPIQAVAEVCDKERPLLEPGTPATALTEALHFILSPMGIAVTALFIVATAARNLWLHWASFGLTSLALIALLINPALPDPTGIRYFAVMEGCIGPQTLSFLLLSGFAGTTAFLARRGALLRRADKNS